MSTSFKTKEGKTFTPDFFAVYHKKDGTTFKKIQDEIDPYNFSEYNNVTKIDLYENIGDNQSPNLVDSIHNP